MEKVYVIKDTGAKDEYCYVDIDRSSSGYPFLRPLIDAHKFYNKKSAIGYMETFHKENWVLQKFEYYATDCTLENEDESNEHNQNEK